MLNAAGVGTASRSSASVASGWAVIKAATRSLLLGQRARNLVCWRGATAGVASTLDQSVDPGPADAIVGRDRFGVRTPIPRPGHRFRKSIEYGAMILAGRSTVTTVLPCQQKTL